MIKRSLMIALAVVFAVLGLNVGSASAASNAYSCASGGTTTTVRFYEDAAYSTPNFDHFAWSTSPNALLNRISINVRDADDGIESGVIQAVGGTTTTVDDVPSSGTTSDSNATLFYNYGHPQWRASVWGGTGSSTASCNTGWHAFP